MRVGLLTICIVVLLFSPLASAKPSPGKHEQDVIRFFLNHPKLAATPAGQKELWRIQQSMWNKLEAANQKIRSLQASFVPNDPKRLREYVYRTDPCLANIIERESAHTWDVTIDYGMGHGDTSGPYGLGQANPGTKMAAYGSDWQTSAKTQLKWARAYAADRYGSTCAAWSHWQRHYAW